MPTECNICLDKIRFIVDRKKTLKKCAHSFHRKCFDLLRNKDECPVCRRLVINAAEEKFLRKSKFLENSRRLDIDAYRLCRLVTDHGTNIQKCVVMPRILSDTNLIARFIDDDNSWVIGQLVGSNKINWHASTETGDTLIDRGLKSASNLLVKRLVFDEVKTPSAPQQ